MWKPEHRQALEPAGAVLLHEVYLGRLQILRVVYLLQAGDAQRRFSLKDETDLDLLHLYVDLEFDDQPFAARIAILDRILALGEERQNQLQYRGAKAIQYFLIGDVKTAELQLSEAVGIVRETEKDEPLEGYERHLFGRLLQLLGSLKHDKDMQGVGSAFPCDAAR